MEGAPSIVEDDDSDEKLEKKSPSKSATNKSELFKFFAFEPKKPEEPKEVSKPEKSEPVAVESVEAPPVEAIIPAPESEAPLEELGELEKPVIERELTMAAQQADAEKVSAEPANPEDAAADQAVEHFRELIIEEGEDSEAAYQQTLAELGVEDGEVDSIEAADEDEPESPDSDPPIPPAGSAASPPMLPTGNRHPEGPNDLPPMPDFGANTAPASPNVARDDEPQVETRYRGNPATSALIGGVIGYLIGRRRGRIKTEKKLLPIQKKLEKQVYDLEWELKKKEMSIRRVAAEKVKQAGPTIIEKLITPKSNKPEHIGQVLISTADLESGQAAERSKADDDHAKTKTNEKLTLPTAGKRVENLSREELLGLSEKIVIEGSTLRQIYETRLVGEHGLRRLVAEHLRGGDLNRALRREIVEREVDFERDPALRDFVPQEAAPSGGGKAKAALDELLKAANVDVSDGSEEIAFFRARARHEAIQLHRHQQQRQLINIGFVSIIAILALVILALFMTRG